VLISRVVAMSDSHQAATGGRAETAAKAGRFWVRARPLVAALSAMDRHGPPDPAPVDTSWGAQYHDLFCIVPRGIPASRLGDGPAPKWK
jgi:hypothetical protein